MSDKDEENEEVVFKVLSKAFKPDYGKPQTGKMIRIKNGIIPQIYYDRFIKKIIETAGISMSKSEFEEMLKTDQNANSGVEIYIDPDNGYADFKGVKNKEETYGSKSFAILKQLNKMVKGVHSKNKSQVVGSFRSLISAFKSSGKKEGGTNENGKREGGAQGTKYENAPGKKRGGFGASKVYANGGKTDYTMNKPTDTAVDKANDAKVKEEKVKALQLENQEKEERLKEIRNNQAYYKNNPVYRTAEESKAVNDISDVELVKALRNRDITAAQAAELENKIRVGLINNDPMVQANVSSRIKNQLETANIISAKEAEVAAIEKTEGLEKRKLELKKEKFEAQRDSDKMEIEAMTTGYNKSVASALYEPASVEAAIKDQKMKELTKMRVNQDVDQLIADASTVKVLRLKGEIDSTTEGVKREVIVNKENQAVQEKNFKESLINLPAVVGANLAAKTAQETALIKAGNDALANDSALAIEVGKNLIGVNTAKLAKEAGVAAEQDNKSKKYLGDDAYITALTTKLKNENDRYKQDTDFQKNSTMYMTQHDYQYAMAKTLEGTNNKTLAEVEKIKADNKLLKRNYEASAYQTRESYQKAMAQQATIPMKAETRAATKDINQFANEKTKLKNEGEKNKNDFAIDSEKNEIEMGKVKNKQSEINLDSYKFNVKEYQNVNGKKVVESMRENNPALWDSLYKHKEVVKNLAEISNNYENVLKTADLADLFEVDTRSGQTAIKTTNLQNITAENYSGRKDVLKGARSLEVDLLKQKYAEEELKTRESKLNIESEMATLKRNKEEIEKKYQANVDAIWDEGDKKDALIIKEKAEKLEKQLKELQSRDNKDINNRVLMQLRRIKRKGENGIFTEEDDKEEEKNNLPPPDEIYLNLNRPPRDDDDNDDLGGGGGGNRRGGGRNARSAASPSRVNGGGGGGNNMVSMPPKAFADLLQALKSEVAQGNPNHPALADIEDMRGAIQNIHERLDGESAGMQDQINSLGAEIERRRVDHSDLDDRMSRLRELVDAAVEVKMGDIEKLHADTLANVDQSTAERVIALEKFRGVLDDHVRKNAEELEKHKATVASNHGKLSGELEIVQNALKGIQGLGIDMSTGTVSNQSRVQVMTDFDMKAAKEEYEGKLKMMEERMKAAMGDMANKGTENLQTTINNVSKNIFREIQENIEGVDSSIDQNHRTLPNKHLNSVIKNMLQKGLNKVTEDMNNRLGQLNQNQPIVVEQGPNIQEVQDMINARSVPTSQDIQDMITKSFQGVTQIGDLNIQDIKQFGGEIKNLHGRVNNLTQSYNNMRGDAPDGELSDMTKMQTWTSKTINEINTNARNLETKIAELQQTSRNFHSGGYTREEDYQKFNKYVEEQLMEIKKKGEEYEGAFNRANNWSAGVDNQVNQHNAQLNDYLKQTEDYNKTIRQLTKSLANSKRTPKEKKLTTPTPTPTTQGDDFNQETDPADNLNLNDQNYVKDKKRKETPYQNQNDKSLDELLGGKTFDAAFMNKVIGVFTDASTGEFKETKRPGSWGVQEGALLNPDERKELQKRRTESDARRATRLAIPKTIKSIFNQPEEEVKVDSEGKPIPAPIIYLSKEDKAKIFSNNNGLINDAGAQAGKDIIMKKLNNNPGIAQVLVNQANIQVNEIEAEPDIKVNILDDAEMQDNLERIENLK